MRKRLIDTAVWLAIFLCGGLLAAMLAYPALAMPLCAEQGDAYELALADTKGDATAVWNEKVLEGKCANLKEAPAEYVKTLMVYTSKEGEETRVAEFCLWGQKIFGLMIGLPRHVHMVVR